jgi:hypothetical protein
MTPRSSQQKPPPPRGVGGLLAGVVVMLSVLTVIGLGIAEAFGAGHADALIVNALVLIALTFGGYGVDRIFDRWR